MKMCRTWIKTLALVLVLALGLAGCGANQKALVGTREVADEEGGTYGVGVRFDKDGSFYFSGAYGAESEEDLEEAFEAMKALYSISYKVKNDTEMKITQKIFGGLGKETSTISYSLKGDTLTLDGVTYHRAK